MGNVSASAVKMGRQIDADEVLSAVYPYGTWEGEILWEGHELKASSIRETEKAGIAIIHQELMMVPHLSVAENIFLGSEISNHGFLDYDAMNARAQELLAKLNVHDINPALPVLNYSGGKQQLIEIAKALNKDAKLLILDEPTSALTATEIRTLLDLIKSLKAGGLACVYISHKLEKWPRFPTPSPSFATAHISPHVRSAI